MRHCRGKSKTFVDQLPDLPPLDLEQGDNIPLNPHTQPLDIPAGEENQQNQAEEPNQIPNLPPEQEEHNHIGQCHNQPNQPPNPPQNLPT